MSEAAPELSLEEKKAAKRKEIEERLAGLKLQQEKEASQKTMYFGEHPGITCDGCGACPMCANHDVCENCYDVHLGGKMENVGKQVLSANATDHSFALHKDKTFKPLVKGKPGEKATAAPKIGANDPCSCGSGKKYKKCCMNK